MSNGRNKAHKKKSVAFSVLFFLPDFFFPGLFFLAYKIPKYLAPKTMLLCNIISCKTNTEKSASHNYKRVHWRGPRVLVSLENFPRCFFRSHWQDLLLQLAIRALQQLRHVLIVIMVMMVMVHVYDGEQTSLCSWYEKREVLVSFIFHTTSSCVSSIY